MDKDKNKAVEEKGQQQREDEQSLEVDEGRHVEESLQEDGLYEDEEGGLQQEEEPQVEEPPREEESLQEEGLYEDEDGQRQNMPVKVESPPEPPRPPDLYRGEEDNEDEINRKSEMPFLDHLEELRRRILWCMGVIFVGILVGFYLNSQFDLLQLLIKPVSPYLKDGKLMIIKPTEGFMIALKLSFAFGLIIASPVMIYHFWAFLAPALLKKERRLVFPLLFASLFMFILGAVMAFFITLPLGMAFFSKFQFASTEFMLTASSYLDMAVRMVFFTGVVFEMPIIILLLARLGIVTPEFLRTKRRHAIITIFVLGMAVTPPDPGSMVLVAAPMIFLYEISVWIAYIVARKRKEA
ncbi:MAG: twin-arginine translocase subunit TatC [Gemmatimonadota bacterium]|nr:twin-arginine translocase subunit TatC [Gemmatimonadota bacterium]